MNRALSRGELTALLLEELARELEVPRESLSLEEPFVAMGLSSVQAVGLITRVGERCGRELPETLPWDFPTVSLLAAHLAGESAPEPFVQGRAAGEPIAIIGMAGRFPGAANVEELWELLCDGRDAISEVSPERWDPRAVAGYEKLGDRLQAACFGGFLSGVDTFDAAFFGLSAREAERMDPQQRLLLEVSWEALEDSGLVPQSLAGSATGIFVGASSSDYLPRQFRRADLADLHACTGNARSVLANRISYQFDLRGPSMAVDTACSSSLVAVHLAVGALRARECELALAGGVNLMLTPDLSLAFAASQMLSKEGRCRAFDMLADGYVRGEGCGVVVLEPLDRAIARRRRIIAVIRGTATNHVGRSNGITAPSGPAQAAVIRRALADAGVSARHIGYVEAHGTGTPLGDPVELNALGEALGESGVSDGTRYVGSVKTNLGHLEAAAGIAGLVKAALCVARHRIPPHLHLQTVNPRIDLETHGFTIPRSVAEWEAHGAPRCAGVSSFGFGGANAHVILGQAPDQPDFGRPARGPRLVCLSAKTPRALERLRQRYSRMLEFSKPELDAISYTALVCRAHHPVRLAVVADDAEDLQRRLARLAVPEASPGAPPKLAFVFAGQGAQVPGMGRSLYRDFAAFRQAIDACAEAFDGQGDFSLTELLFGESSAAAAALAQTRYLQPALFAFEWALASLFRALGVEPEVVLGHSLGEYVAACVAGALEPREALLLLCARGRLMQSADTTGGMLACRIGDGELRNLLLEHPELELAALNAPNQCVLAGAHETLNRIRERLGSDSGAAVFLRVSHAFHSRAMEPMLDAFERVLEKVRFAPLTRPLASNLEGRLLPAGHVLDAGYFRRQLRHTVRFREGVEAVLGLGTEVFLEIAPKPTLTPLVASSLREGASHAACLAASAAGAMESHRLLETIARLYSAGQEIRFEALFADGPRRPIPLPGYPFEPERFWVDDALAPSRAGHERGTAPREAAAAIHLRAEREQDMPMNDEDRSLKAVIDFMGQQLATIRAFGGASDGVAAPRPRSSSASELDSAAVGAHVRACVAAIGGFREGYVQDVHRLNEDLGFNSLMTGELIARLRARFGEIASDGLPADPRVSEIAERIASAGARPVTPSPAPIAPDEPAPGRERRAPLRRETGDVESWEEYREIAGRLRDGLQGEPSPYARTHEGMNRGTTRVGNRSVVNFAAFNYLGLSAEREVCEAAKRAIDRYGTSASATPLLLGETPLHHELADEVASFLGAEGAIVFASGHQTNVGTIGHLLGADDLIIHDQYIHDSSVRGAMLSGAKYRSFPHNDVAALDRMLAAVRGEYRRVLICVEGIYSQDGDIVDLPAVIAVKKKHEAMLIVDEAHSIGVLGRSGAGVGEHFGVDRRDVDLWMGTLSKALGSCGGYVAGSRALIDYMRHTTPLFIFSTGISPANAAAALAAIRFVRAHPERVQRLAELATGFLQEARQYGFDVGSAAPGSPIVPIIVGAWSRAIHLSNALLERGVNVMPIGYPAVAKEQARLRFFVNADHDREELRDALEALRALTSGSGVAARSKPAALAPRRAVARSVETGAA